MKNAKSFLLKKQIEENIIAHLSIVNLSKDINFIINKIYKKLIIGGKLIFCGNGGSAADAQHIAAECLVRLKPNNNRKPIPMISLALDSSTMTACANDYSFKSVTKQ